LLKRHVVLASELEAMHNQGRGMGRGNLAIARKPAPSAIRKLHVGQPRNARREQVAAMLDDRPGQHVILVRYTGSQSPHEQWVYNSADIDSQDVIWAHDLGATDNAAILAYYKDRQFWSFQPDSNSIRLEPYAPGN